MPGLTIIHQEALHFTRHLQAHTTEHYTDETGMQRMAIITHRFP